MKLKKKKKIIVTSEDTWIDCHDCEKLARKI